MPTGVKREDEIDKRADEMFNSHPDLQDAENSTGEAYTQAGIDQAEAFANTNSSAEAAKTSEENPLNYRPDPSPSDTKKSFSLKGTFKKKGPIGGIIGLILGGVGGLSLLFTPGMAAVQLKEILTDDLNDQLTAMDKRSVYVMRAKLNDLGKGICTGIKIRCGFKGMSDRQLNKFKAAGFEVETDGKVFGRNHIVSMSIKDSRGNTIEIDNPRALNRALGDRVVRNAVRKAFNPKFAGFFDGKWDDFKSRYNLTSQDKLGAGTDEERRNAITSAVDGQPIDDLQIPDKLSEIDEDGNPIEENSKTNQEIDRVQGSVTNGGVDTSSLVEAGSKGALRGIGVLGAADTLCTVKNSMRAVEAGAKIHRHKQLIRYSMVFLTFADSIKAGTATPEQAETVGNILTSVDTRKKIVDENGTIDASGNDSKIENPYYGANAFDSAGYKTAMYNDAPSLSSRDMQMAVGGGLSLSLLSKFNTILREGGADNCTVVQNWFVRGGSILAGVAIGAITLGASLAVSVSASVAFSMMLPILENYLAQMISGKVADGNTSGVDAGNAIFAGSAALMGGMAMARGMKPATKNDLQSYLATTNEVKAEYVAMETEEAKSSPFDTSNKYSFLGSLTRTLLPLQTTSSLTLGNTFISGLSTVANAVIPTPKALAKNGYNEERFSRCADEGYKDIGIDADVFCNVRYVMSDYEMNLDTEEVRAQMLAWGEVNDDEEGTPVSGSSYEKWIEECTIRQDVGWGETNDESNAGKGAGCMNSTDTLEDTDDRGKFGDDKTLSYFRVFHMDKDIIAAMDYEGPTSTNSSDNTNTGVSFDGEIAWPVDKKYWELNRADFTGAHFANSGTWTNGIDSLAVDLSTPSSGATVYAMLGGTVTNSDLGGHGLVITSSVDGGSVSIAYAHGPRVNQSSSYSAGEEIMKIGCLGNCSGPHLHIDMSFTPTGGTKQGICPQDVFISMGNNDPINWSALAQKAQSQCSGRS